MKTGSFNGGNLLWIQTAFYAAWLVLAPAAPGASTNLPVRYDVVEIPGLAGHDWSEASGLNDLGQVVGASGPASMSAQAGFVWDRGVATALSTPGGIPILPTGINRQGQVAGYYGDGPRIRGVIWNHGLVMELMALPNGSNAFAMPLAINDAGVAAGNSVLTNQSRAAFWSNGVITVLAGLPGTGASWAQAINVWGNMAGAVNSNSIGMSYGRAVAWENGRVWDLGALAGGNTSSANAMNDYGQTAGSSDGLESSSRPFYFTEGQRVDIGLLPGMVRGSATAMNNLSQVVGYNEDIRDNSRAFVYRGGLLQDLNALIPTNSGWTLYEATAINDRGQIAGYGQVAGHARAFLLTPQGLSSNLMPPSVSVVSPTNGARFQTGTPVALDARVSDPDDRVFLVEYFIDGQKAGWRTNRPFDTRVSASPFAMTWSNAPAGSHTITMRATDHCGLTATSAPVSVQFESLAPVVVQGPVAQSVAAGQSVTLSVQAEGAATLFYQWQKDGVNVPRGNGAALQFNPVMPEDAGYYRVLVQNSHGSVTSAVARLVVMLPQPGGRPAPGDQVTPAVAASQRQYLVVWADSRGGSASGSDIYAARVSPDGVILDPQGIRVCGAPRSQGRPAVASDGLDFMVVWQDERGLDVAGGISTELDIYGARVTAAGLVLDPDGFPISQAPGGQQQPSVAFNGTNYLVVWTDARAATNFNRGLDIYGARIAAGGHAMDPGGLAVCALVNNQSAPRVTAWAGRFYVAWSDERTGAADVYYAQVDVNGTVHPSTLAGPFNGFPAVAANPTGLLVVAADYRNSRTTRHDIFGRRIPFSGGSALPLVLSAAPQDQTEPAAAAADQQFMTVWTDKSAGLDDVQILGARVSSSGQVENNGWMIATRTESRVLGQPAVGAMADGYIYLVAWTSIEPDTASGFDIRVARVDSDGFVLDPNGVLVTTADVAAPDLEWNWPEPIAYGSALTGIQLNAVSSVPGTFVYIPAAGTVLQAGTNFLTVEFTPDDLFQYAPVQASRPLLVLRAPLTITALNTNKHQGQINPVFPLVYEGLVNDDTPDLWSGVELAESPATDQSLPGQYPILVRGIDLSSYEVTRHNGVLTVLPARTQAGSVVLGFNAHLTGGSVRDLAFEAGGAMIAGGDFTGIGGLPRNGVARLLADRSVDPAFNPPSSPRWAAKKVACQPDGRVLVAGWWAEPGPSGPVSRPLLARLLPNGAADPGFNTSAHGLASIEGLALQADGKILVLGDPGWCCEQRLVRLLPDGVPDPAFNPQAMIGGQAYSLIVQPDGGILVAGSFLTLNGLACSAIGRFWPDGSLERGFETGFGYTGLSAVALLPDGRILVGTNPTQPGEQGQVFRLRGSGGIEDSFQTPLLDAAVRTLAVQPDGRILIGGGFATVNGVARKGIARLLADGRLDLTFDPAEGFEGSDMEVVVLAAGDRGAVWAGGYFETVGRVPRNGLVLLDAHGTGPRIESVTPGFGRPGAEVVLRGGGFSETPGENTVWFGAARATVLSASSGMLRVSVPTGATDGPVTVAVSGRVVWAPQPFAVTYAGNGLFDTNSLAARVDLPATDRTTPRVVLGDLDGDGRPDMVVAVEGLSAGHGSVFVYRNIGVTGVLAPSSFALACELPAGVRTTSVALADLDGDGRLDLAATDVDLAAGRVWVWVNSSQPGFMSFAAPFSLQAGAAPSAVAVQDFNRDGVPDLAVASSGDNTVCVLEGLGAGLGLSAASFAAPAAFAVDSTPGWVAGADLDGDGWADLVVANHWGESLSILRNTGSAGAITGSSFEPAVRFPAGIKPMVVSVGDLDGDGKPDLAVAAYGEGIVSLLRNVGQPGVIDAASFAPRIVLSFGGAAHMAAIADIDGDGRADLLVAGEYRDFMSVWTNSGASPLSDQTFVLAAEFPAGLNSSCVAVGDLDGDGRPDVAVANDYSYNVSIYHNRVPSPGPASVARPPLARAVFAGQPASFEVVANGAAPLAFQWSLNNSPIPGATGAVLRVPHARFSDQGDYRVSVANALGSMQSTAARLTVMPLPAGPGSLDPAFDPALGGQAPPWPAINEYEASFVISMPDGRVIVAGDFTSYQGKPCHGLARLKADGSLDRPFALAPFDLYGVRVNALALAPDGKMLVAFQAWYLAPNDEVQGLMRLVRLNPDGGLDPAWSWDGDFREGWIHSLAMLPDGKILIGGDFMPEDGPDYLARLHPNGQLDPSFGRQPPSWDPYFSPDITSMLVQPDGRVLVSGHFRFDSPARAGLARIEPSGALDTSFTLGLPVSATIPNALVLQPDGKILVAQAIDPWTGQSGLARFLPDGRLDLSFVSPPSSVRCNAVALLDDLTIVVAPEGWQGIQLSWLNTDGSLKELWPLDLAPESFAMVKSLAVQPGGRVLAGGVFDSVRGYPVMPVARFSTGAGAPFVTRSLPPFYSARVPVQVALSAAPGEGVQVYAIEELPPEDWIVSEISEGGAYDARTGKVKFGPFFDSVARVFSYTVTPPWPGGHGTAVFAGTASADGAQMPVAGPEGLVEALPHPADRTPEDSSLSISEVTAYGAAWRRGDPWLAGPSPILIDYVTRAAMLWRQGECYEFDGTVPAPLCWVPCGSLETRLPVALGATPELAAATRSSLPVVYTPLAPMAVSIFVQPASGARSYAMEDQCPAGWMVSAISEGGEFDAVQGLVKWGPFVDNRPRVLSYRATPPAGARDRVAFAGRVSIDGVSALAPAARQIGPATRLSLRAAPEGGGFQVDTGAASGTLVIESSTDFIHWTPAMTLTDPSGWIALPAPVASEKARFFRARLDQ